MTVASAKKWPMLALAALGIVLLAASTALATHPRPKGATPFRVPLVPSYMPCTAPDRTHGPPLAFPACNPPVQASGHVTVGTPDANGALANSAGIIRIDVLGSVEPPDAGEVQLVARIGDVRCKPATSACGSANMTGGPDYTGELQADATVRITDHWNATAPGGGPDAATVVDIPFPITMMCAATADTSIGGTCAANTSVVQPGVPGTSTKRGVVGITQFEVFDGGADGLNSTAGNDPFAAQGLFVP